MFTTFHSCWNVNMNEKLKLEWHKALPQNACYGTAIFSFTKLYRQGSMLLHIPLITSPDFCTLCVHSLWLMPLGTILALKSCSQRFPSQSPKMLCCLNIDLNSNYSITYFCITCFERVVLQYRLWSPWLYVTLLQYCFSLK